MSSDVRSDRVVKINPIFSIRSCTEPTQKLSDKFAYLLSNTHDILPQAEVILNSVYGDLPKKLYSGFNEKNSSALLEIHKILFAIYETSLSHPFSPICLHEHSPWLLTIRKQIETAWLNYELPKIKSQLPDISESKNPELLCNWLLEQASHESESDKQVLKFLENEASASQFNLFILSDAILNYRFCDALALAQIHFSEIIKAEIVSNMFDECGHGKAEKSHSRKFTKMLISLGLEQPTASVWGDDYRPYAGHNLYFLFGLNRRHFFKSIGSLAMPELFDSNRDRSVVAGLARLYPDGQVNYDFYTNHIEIDEVHGLNWLKNAISPIVEVQPEAGMELAIGGALRMKAMKYYNEYLATRFELLP